MKPRTAALEIAKKLPEIVLSLIIIVGIVMVSSVLGLISPVITDLNTLEGYIRLVLISALMITILLFMVRLTRGIVYILDRILAVIEFHLPGMKQDEPSLKKILKNMAYIVILVLAVAFFSPILFQIPIFGKLAVEVFVLINLSISLILIYDIARTYEKITERNAKTLVNIIEKVLASIKKVKT